MTSNSLTGDERDLVEKITRHNLAILPEPERGPDGREFIGRAQHGKHHGCVRSTFTVAPDLPERLRHGVFAEPGKAFAALVRFSNGRAKDDSEADAHGMAIKLLDVAGARLAGQEWQTTQDFVLVDDELFFSGDLGQYEEINRLVAEAKESILAKLSLTPAVKLITALRLKGVGDGEVLDAVRDFAGQKPASPLATHYWSTTPYRLGEAVVKYMAVSRRALEQRPEQVGENYLAEALKARTRGRRRQLRFLRPHPRRQTAATDRRARRQLVEERRRLRQARHLGDPSAGGSARCQPRRADGLLALELPRGARADRQDQSRPRECLRRAGEGAARP